MKAILILNAGSSSLKFALFPMTPRLADLPQLSGQVEGIGAEPMMHARDNHSGERFTEALAVPEGADQNGQHRVALEFIFEWNSKHATPSPISMREAPGFDLMTPVRSLISLRMIWSCDFAPEFPWIS